MLVRRLTLVLNSSGVQRDFDVDAGIDLSLTITKTNGWFIFSTVDGDEYAFNWTDIVFIHLAREIKQLDERRDLPFRTEP